MPHTNQGVTLTLGTPATYRITVQGCLDDSWVDHLAGLSIKVGSQGDHAPVTTLAGRVMDQAELLGVLNGLYELHLPLLSVELLSIEKPSL
jgi:hypothetical protein